MLVSIENVAINEHDIIITAANLEKMLLADDLFTPMDGDEEVRLLFDASNMGHRKYLYKICQSQRQAKDKKSLGEMIEALQGCIVSLSEGFLER